MLDIGIGTKIQYQYGICIRTSDIYRAESLLHFSTAHDKDAEPSLPSLLRKMSNVAKIQTEASRVAASPGKCNKCLRIFACKWGKTPNFMKHLTAHGIQLKAEERSRFCQYVTQLVVWASLALSMSRQLIMTATQVAFPEFSFV